MIRQRLSQELEEVARRYRRLCVWTTLSASWLFAALAGVGLLVTGWKAGWTSAWAAPVLAVVALAATIVGVVLARRAAGDPRWTARLIEAKHAELETLLLAAVEQEPTLPGGEFGFLQQGVIRDSLAHGRRNDYWQAAVPTRRIRLMQATGLATLALLVFVIGQMAGYASHRAEHIEPPGASGSPTTMPSRVTIIPGDTEIERGTTLIVTARFDGVLPDDATLVYHDGSGETIREPMSLSLSDPMFGGRVAGVRSDLSYRVEYAERTTRDYRVRVYEHPELKRADARLVFPEYTSLGDKRVEDTRRITAVEGTEVTLSCRLNKPVASARLAGEDGPPAELAAEAGDPAVYSITHTLEKSARYRLHLTDADGRKNKQPPEFVFNATPNRPPDVKIAMPARDMRVSPIEELETKASIWDDFGLRSYGISYALAGDPPQDVVLGRRTAGNQRQEVEHLIDFESLAAEPDRLASYYFWAEDIGPDSQPRRTFGDMYFAEVRHFEEIFRRGQQPPGGADQQRREQQQQQQEGGGNRAQQAEQLAEKQKQIINATWKVIRRETRAQPSEEFAADARQLQTAQQEALEQLLTLADEIDDAESEQHAAEVGRQMDKAITHLTDAVESASPAALGGALAAEQAAYQALLKLRARESEVIRANRQEGQQQRQSGSASGSQSRAQQQLDQLELRSSENRYETQREARAQQEQTQRETRQVLNRLRELARRQSDLNQRLKELQSALDEAGTEREREEIRRQLKRLRDEQQQILRDTDDLSQRMQQPENQERMAESRQDLEQTRDNIRQTTEALREGQVSRAVASGTRAERELREMREDFRRQASDRFSEEVRQLRDDARQLDENENRLAERLRNLHQDKPENRKLRDSDQRRQVGEGFQQQRRDLDRLMEDMQETIEEAQETEPLMTERLYDTLRRTRQQKLEDMLEVTRALVDRAFVDQARSAESAAGKGIEQLRQGVEGAAESVLGDENEALRRAHDALTDLANQLNEEIRSADAREPRGQRPEQETRQQQDGQPQDGQSVGGQAPGNRQPNDRQDQQADRPTQRQPAPQPPGADARRPTAESTRPQTRPNDRRDPSLPGGLDRFIDADRAAGPITGADFIRWSDQLRDVEEMLDDRQLRGEAARIRDRARGIRRDLRRNFKGPNWDIVREFVAQPLNELRDRVAEELLKRGAKESLVPIDRDPVPPKYADQVRRYYEQLGSGR